MLLAGFLPGVRAVHGRKSPDLGFEKAMLPMKHFKSSAIAYLRLPELYFGFGRVELKTYRREAQKKRRSADPPSGRV